MSFDQIELKQLFEKEASHFRFVFFRVTADDVDTAVDEATETILGLSCGEIVSCDVLAVFDTVPLLQDEYSDIEIMVGDSGVCHADLAEKRGDRSWQRFGPDFEVEINVPYTNPFLDENDPMSEGTWISFVRCNINEKAGVCSASFCVGELEAMGKSIQIATPLAPDSEIAVSVAEKMRRFQSIVLGNRSEKLRTALASIAGRDQRLYEESLDPEKTWAEVGKIVGEEFNEDILRKAAENAARRFWEDHQNLDPIPPRRLGRRPKKRYPDKK